MMDTETCLEAKRKISATKQASESRTQQAPDSSPVMIRSPIRSPKKYRLRVGSDDVSKDLERTESISRDPLDAVVSATLAQENREDMKKLF